MSQTHRVALRLSNLQGLAFDGFPQAVSPTEARKCYEALSKGSPHGEQTLQAYRGAGLLLWMPMENEAALRVAAAYLAYSTAAQSECLLQLLVPHDVYHGCDSPQSILDLWSHPLLGTKWNSIVKGIEFLRQPARCVFSGMDGPMYQIKSLAVITLAYLAPTVPKTMTQWRNNLEQGALPTIIVDCEAEKEHLTRRTLASLGFGGLIGWEGPCRSLGSNSACKRIRFSGYFDPVQVSDLDVQFCVTTLLNMESMRGVLTGSANLFANPSSMLADVANPACLTDYGDLIAEVVLSSPRLAVLRTSASTQMWIDKITEQTRRDPEKAVTRVRFKPSQHGGRTFARPALLESTVRSAKAAAKSSRREGTATGIDSEFNSIVVIRGPYGGHPLNMVHMLMQRIS